MNQMPHAFKVSLIACSIPSALIALIATVGAWLQWGGLSFSNPVYYVTLAVAAWCPVSKIVMWRLWRREVNTCLTCVPVKSVEKRLTSMAHAGSTHAPVDIYSDDAVRNSAAQLNATQQP